MSMPDVSLNPQAPTHRLQSTQPMSLLEEINNLFQSPGSVDIRIRGQLLEQLQTQIEKFERFSPDDNHYFHFSINNKNYDVYQLKDEKTQELFNQRNSVSFMTEDGKKNMTRPVSAGGAGGAGGAAGEGNFLILGKFDLNNVVRYILKESFAHTPAETSDEDTMRTTFESLYKCLKHKAGNDSVVIREIFPDSSQAAGSNHEHSGSASVASADR